MPEDFEIKNKVASSGLVNFDIAELYPKGERIGLDIKDFLIDELILREKDFRESVKLLDISKFENQFVYIYNSVDAIVPLWAYFLIAAALSPVTKKVVFGSREDLDYLLMHDAITHYDFTKLKDKRVLVKGCTEIAIPQNAYIELVERLRPIVKALMFGEACSNVPIFKN